MRDSGPREEASAEIASPWPVTALRIALFGAGLALTWAGYSLYATYLPARTLPGSAALLLSLPLFALSLRPVAPRTGGPGEEPVGRIARGTLRRRLSAAAAAGAVAAGTMALRLFPANDARAWTWYAASLCLFSAAGLGALPEAGHRKRPGPTAFAALLAIFAIAAALRLWRLTEIPTGVWWDEANQALAAFDYGPNHQQQPFFDARTQLPAHYLKLLSLVFSAFGQSIWSVRFLTVLFGLGAVLLAFDVGRSLFGTRAGLFAAYFLGVGRWPLTFSRFGLVTGPAPFFVLLSLALLLRAWRRPSLAGFSLAGLAIGTGLGFYFAFRLFVFVVVAFIFGFATHDVRKRRSLRRPLLAGLALAAGTTAGAAPVVQSAVLGPAAFFTRTRTVSIFNEASREDKDLGTALLSNARRHALMFHAIGDANGRHNLPGAPMLDHVTGVLLIAGLGAAIASAGSLGSFLAVTTLLAGLMGGILSLEFEAPQAARSIAAIPGVMLLAALAAEAALRLLSGGSRFLGGVRGTAAAGVAALALAVCLHENTRLYFFGQGSDDTCFFESEGVKTVAARRINDFASMNATILGGLWLTGDPVVQFLSGGKNVQPFQPEDGFPIAVSATRPVILLQDPRSRWIEEGVRRTYPGARQLTDRSPNGKLALDTFLLSPFNLSTLQGYHVTLLPSDLPQPRSPVRTLADPIEPSLPSGVVSVTYDATLRIPRFGPYTLVHSGPGPLELSIDGDSRTVQPGERAAYVLAMGPHRLGISGPPASFPATLNWKTSASARDEPIPVERISPLPPIEPHGLLGSYVDGPKYKEPADLQRIDPTLNIYFHWLPFGRRPQTIRWSGLLDVPETGSWAFHLWLRGAGSVTLDGHLLLDAPGPGTEYRTMVDLSAGSVPIQVDFVDTLDSSEIRLYWTPPGKPEEIVPTSAFRPFSARPANQPVFSPARGATSFRAPVPPPPPPRGRAAAL